MYCNWVQLWDTTQLRTVLISSQALILQIIIIARIGGEGSLLYIYILYQKDVSLSSTLRVGLCGSSFLLLEYSIEYLIEYSSTI